MNALRMLGCCIVALAVALPLRAEGELEGRATWQVPTSAEVGPQLEKHLAGSEALPAAREQAARLTAAQPPLAGEALLEAFIEALAQASAGAREVFEFSQLAVPPRVPPRFALLHDENTPPLVRGNLRLFYGRWLAHHRYYDECAELLADLTPADVVDPATLLFYQAAGYHRLLNKDKCLPLIARLLENESRLPRRYVDVARLMQADLAPLKPDTLNEVARLMDDIERRLDQGRAGKKVRDEEEEVVRKLDKMIEELEKKLQQMQQQASGNGGGSQSTQPMQDSQSGGGKGEGNVDPKKIVEKGGWGNLPPKEREEALQQIGKDLPAHYRDVIEEYFRKLARDGVE